MNPRPSVPQTDALPAELRSPSPMFYWLFFDFRFLGVPTFVPNPERRRDGFCIFLKTCASRFIACLDSSDTTFFLIQWRRVVFTSACRTKAWIVASSSPSSRRFVAKPRRNPCQPDQHCTPASFSLGTMTRRARLARLRGRPFFGPAKMYPASFASPRCASSIFARDFKTGTGAVASAVFVLSRALVFQTVCVMKN